MKDYKNYMENITADERLYNKVMQSQDVRTNSRVIRFTPVHALAASLAVVVALTAAVFLFGDNDFTPTRGGSSTGDGGDLEGSGITPHPSIMAVIKNVNNPEAVLIEFVNTMGNTELAQFYAKGVSITTIPGTFGEEMNLQVGDTIMIYFNGVMLQTSPSILGQVYDIHLHDRVNKIGSELQHTLDELDHIRNIVFNDLLNADLPLASCYVREEDLKIVFEFVCNENSTEMAEIRVKAAVIAAEFIERRLAALDGKFKAPAMDTFLFVGVESMVSTTAAPGARGDFLD